MNEHTGAPVRRRQAPLLSTGPLPAEDTAAASSYQLVEVAVPVPVFQPFTYWIPPEMVSRVQPGSRVLVPFGRRRLIGLAVSEPRPGDARQLKPLRAVPDTHPVLGRDLLELGQWLAEYYIAPPGEALRVMLPPGLLGNRVADQDREEGWPARRRLAIVAVEKSGEPETVRQQELLEELGRRDLPVSLSGFARQVHCSLQTLRKLASRGWIRIEPVRQFRSPWEDRVLPDYGEVAPHMLSADQQKALQILVSLLDKNEFSSLLLHGVTGSGKTEIYLNLIRRALEQGKSALMLIPEIGLTPQISHLFRAWFRDQVAILHSGLSNGERFDEWERIRQGKARVAVGTRSAVFAPLVELGLIIVDEEQDSSYKQEEMPRYHARETALRRGKLSGALIVLGSATPQLETYHLARQGRRHAYADLPSRVLDRPLARVRIVDMRTEFERKGKEAILSLPLLEAIEGRFRRGEQVMVLLNRRGYAPVLLCRGCGQTESCRNCSISLTYHHRPPRLVCHYCGYSRGVPRQCRSCGREFIYFLGQGTEKIQEMLSGLFPRARIGRLDRDTVRRKGSFHRILADFVGGKTDLLVGTQMISKGHDFPRVTLVGVLMAEQTLRLADFRAAERTFQLLTQVAGRAGRGEREGEVIIQTYYPNHYSLKYACEQDFQKFFEHEVDFRKKFRYPPFTLLANLLVQESRLDRVRARSQGLVEILRRHRERFSSPARMRILGPAPAALERLKGQYRFQILVKATSRKELTQVLSASRRELSRDGRAARHVTIDIDPVNLL